MKPTFAIAFLASAFIQSSLAVSFEWDCTNSLGTCENYCYAAQCSPGFGGGKKFTYDSDSKAADARRVQSGCSKNPCNAATGVSPFNKFGTSCDEFPFASTKEGGTGASLRCVHPTDNSSEGGQLSQFYKKLKSGDKFDIFIKNFIGAPSCGAKPSCKNSDSSQFKMNSAGTMVKNPKRSEAGVFEASEPTSAIRPVRTFKGSDGSEYLLLNNNPDDRFEGTQVWSEAQNGYVTIVEETTE